MKKLYYLLVIIVIATATIGVMLLYENIARRQEEAKQVVFKLVDLNEQTIDPAQWGKNFPRQYDGYKRTAEHTGTKYGGGGSETLSPSKLEEDPRLKTIKLPHGELRLRAQQPVWEFDGRPALAVYAEALGLEPQQVEALTLSQHPVGLMI